MTKLAFFCFWHLLHVLRVNDSYFKLVDFRTFLFEMPLIDTYVIEVYFSHFLVCGLFFLSEEEDVIYVQQLLL